VPGIKEEILVSNVKARFLLERLPEIVGNQYFWMEILCVDQRIDANRVAITQHIPSIFRFAQRTVAVWDGDVFAPCCADSTDFDEMIRHSLAPSRITGYLDLGGNQSFFQALFSHLETAHHHVSVLDGLLFRLWPLQEILLSDTLQFVACGSGQTSTDRYADPGIAAKVNTAFVFTALHFMASMWEEYGGEQPLLSDHNISSKSHFIYAFFRYGTVHRARTSRIRPDCPTEDDFLNIMTSTRRTSKSRDFILAVMPQYGFYTVPANAKSMTFSTLLLDCFRQLEARASDLSLNIPGQLTGKQGVASVNLHDVPEPRLLSDFAKLFLGPKLSADLVYQRPQLGDAESVATMTIRRNLSSYKEVYAYEVAITPTNATWSDAVRYVSQSKHQSRGAWSFATVGDLCTSMLEGNSNDSALVVDPDDLIVPNWPSLQPGEQTRLLQKAHYDILRVLWCMSTEAPTEDVSDFITRTLKPDILIHIAALINCGLGSSAYLWSRKSMKPVIVHFMDRDFLSLVPVRVMEKVELHDFYLVELKYKTPMGYVFALLARLKEWTSQEDIVQCQFPVGIDHAELRDFLEEVNDMAEGNSSASVRLTRWMKPWCWGLWQR
jgi:hypothetical protein